jgi:hypothetical protein
VKSERNDNAFLCSSSFPSIQQGSVRSRYKVITGHIKYEINITDKQSTAEVIPREDDRGRGAGGGRLKSQTHLPPLHKSVNYTCNTTNL